MQLTSLRDAIVSVSRRSKPKLLGLALGMLLFAVSASVLSVTLFSHFRSSDSGFPTEDSGTQTTSPFSRGIVPGATSSGTDQGAPPAVSPPPPLDPNSLPSQLTIDSIGVDAPVVVLGTGGEGVPQVPLNGTEVGWYHFSSLPIQGSNAVFSGHVEWGSDHAVFERLADIKVGDKIRVAMSDGTVMRFDVTTLFEIDPTDPTTLGLMGPTPGDVITLITCGGTWVPDPEKIFGGDYSERLVVRATHVPQGDTATLGGF